MRICIALAAILAAPACAQPNGPDRIPPLDHTQFVANVEPVLELRCANPSCHGNDRRALRVYAPGRFRLDPTRLHLAEPLSADELASNEVSAAAFAADITRADDSLLLSKPTGRAAHLGGIVFTDPTDREPTAIRTWLQTGDLP